MLALRLVAFLALTPAEIIERTTGLRARAVEANSLVRLGEAL